MVVKEQRGRRRYILFTISSEFTKDSLIRSFKNIACVSTPYVVQCESSLAIVRCSPTEIEETKKYLKIIDLTSTSVITSGTLKSIRDSYPILKIPKRQSK